jgi:hypothetical protein
MAPQDVLVLTKPDHPIQNPCVKWDQPAGPYIAPRGIWVVCKKPLLSVKAVRQLVGLASMAIMLSEVLIVFNASIAGRDR